MVFPTFKYTTRGKCRLISAIAVYLRNVRKNLCDNYTSNSTNSGKSYCERDLGIPISSNPRPRNQCITAKNRANKVISFITRSVRSRNAEVTLRLSLAISRLCCTNFGLHITELADVPGLRPRYNVAF